MITLSRVSFQTKKRRLGRSCRLMRVLGGNQETHLQQADTQSIQGGEQLPLAWDWQWQTSRMPDRVDGSNAFSDLGDPGQQVVPAGLA